MEFEIFNFIRLENTDPYQENKPIRIGVISLHIKHLGIYVQGISVFKKKEFYSFKFPSLNAANSKSGKHFSFPILRFEGNGCNRLMEEFLRKNIPLFLKEWNENHLDCPTAIERKSSLLIFTEEIEE